MAQISTSALGRFIREQREHAQLSLREMARMADISNAYLSQVERGLHEPSIRVLNALADALEVPVQDLITAVTLVSQVGKSSCRSKQRSEATRSWSKLRRTRFWPSTAPTCQRHEGSALEGIHPPAATLLEARGVEVEIRARALAEAELLELLAGFGLLGIWSNTTITAQALASAAELTAIGCFCIGTNQVDLKAATARGVAVFNAPYSNTRSVVELVIGAIIALARRLPEKIQRMHEGVRQVGTR
jgi:transcriptional regulator with XRE-family HTH domain